MEKVFVIVKDTALVMWHRNMDAIDPEIAKGLRRTASGVAGVEEVRNVRARWLGHTLEMELQIKVNEDLPTRESHRLAEQVRHTLFHAEPKLTTINVHVDPCGHSGDDAHISTAHHRQDGSIVPLV